MDILTTILAFAAAIRAKDGAAIKLNLGKLFTFIGQLLTGGTTAGLNVVTSNEPLGTLAEQNAALVELRGACGLPAVHSMQSKGDFLKALLKLFIEIMPIILPLLDPTPPGPVMP